MATSIGCQMSESFRWQIGSRQTFSVLRASVRKVPTAHGPKRFTRCGAGGWKERETVYRARCPAPARGNHRLTSRYRQVIPSGDCRVASIAGICLMNATGQAPRWVLRRSSGRLRRRSELSMRLREGRLLFNVRGGKADDRRGTLEHSSLLTHLHHHSPSKSEPTLSQVREAV